ncbi:neprilysin-4-like isoform X2 [Paramacrobiotus metropolitanus]|uniref:neprilysin-4-like isoform X2 n=1 Tax=Paramacrobiotus metropolitanus TaxID=2943436 RepID=UPI002445D2B7|nr:neprilysin-4-like isoform X2 [Paramacrobiotus metropolitanus]
MVSLNEILGFIQSGAMMLSLIISGIEKSHMVEEIQDNKTGLIPSKEVKDQDADGPIKNNVCQTEACSRAAKDLLASIDKTVDPCNDFFAYSCNNWIKSHPLPADKASVSTFSVLGDVLKTQLLGVLNETTELNPSKAKTAVRKFFQLCATNEDQQQFQTDELEPILMALKNAVYEWPAVTSRQWNYSATQPLADYLRRLSIYYAVHPLVDLSRGSSPQTNLNQTRIGSDAQGVVEWKTFLANISQANVILRNAQLSFRKMTIQQLEADYFSKSAFAKNFTAFLQSVVTGYNSTFQINGQLSVYVENPEAFRQLDERLLGMENNVTAQRNLINYLGWTLLYEYNDILPRVLREFVEAFERKITGKAQQPPRWKDCIDTAGQLFSQPLGALYTEKIVPQEARTRVQQMVKDLREAFREIITNTTWMQAATRDQALAKLGNMEEYELYPDFFLDTSQLDADYNEINLNASLLDLSVYARTMEMRKQIRYLVQAPSRRELIDRMAPTAQVNAFYEPSTNALAILAGISQSPFFHPDIPDYVNYARLGAVIGHEITHGFDDTGSTYDKDGNLQNWWTTDDRQAYDDRAAGIVHQYDAYRSDVGMNINGNLTQGENIADSGGFKAALLAYRKRTRDRGPINSCQDLKVNQSNKCFSCHLAIFGVATTGPKCKSFSC